MVIQAAASEPLWTWLMENLRPVDSDTLRTSTRGFGERFGGVIPPPPSATSTSSSPPLAKAEWHAALSDLLMRLQTNLFYITDECIGIFALACQLEHSCRPNANVSVRFRSTRPAGGAGMAAPTDPTLIISAERGIAAGERVSFNYMADEADGAPISDATPLSVRRQRLEASLGFVCHCCACEEQEAQLAT